MVRSYPSSRLRFLQAVPLALAVVIAAAGEVQGQGGVTARPNTAPPFLLEAAAASANDFAYALAEAGVSAGFIVFPNESIERSVERGTDTIWHLRNSAPARGLKVLRGRVADKARTVRLEGVALTGAFRKAMRIVDPAIEVGGGSPGSIIGGLHEPVAITPEPVISLDEKDVTLVDVLNGIVRQAPGTVWVLTWHGEPKGEAGYYTLAFRVPRGRHTTFREKVD